VLTGFNILFLTFKAIAGPDRPYIIAFTFHERRFVKCKIVLILKELCNSFTVTDEKNQENSTYR
jgi:hypothetical protein